MNNILVYLSVLYDGNWNKIYDAIVKKVDIDKKDMDIKLENIDDKYITILDSNYPKCLKSIYKPPFVLFYKGDINVLNEESLKLAVIGSRNNSDYGKNITETICKELVLKEKIVIVSGLAKGIDSIAHQTCLDNKGKTIAVLGNGLNYVYPKENKKLYEDIIKDGLLISEYPPNVSPKPNYFKERNRIIAAISDGVIVTEAKKNSGTMNTVSHALENGKQIFCVPDRLTSDSGCNILIKEGAKLIENASDVLEEYS